MKNKTAVQIFFEDLCHLGYIEYPDESLVQDRLNLAIEIEKQQIIDAANIPKEQRWYEDKYNSCGEKYYSETYNKPT